MAVTESGHLASRDVDELYRRHGSEVYRYAYAVLGNHADAEDVTQTAFLNAYRALGQGVRPRKPSNWLLAIASNAIKQKFRSEQARPRQVELDETTAGADVAESEGPTVGELLAALAKIPPQQRQAIVLREFEGRAYVEIAEILGVTTSALETLLFRARRSLADELEQQLTCTEAQAAISLAADGRLGRKERRRLRDHLGECPDCARFVRVQQRHRRALKGLLLLPVPLSLHFAPSLQGTASAAVLPGAMLPAATLTPVSLSTATLPAATASVAVLPVATLPAAAGSLAAGGGAATAGGGLLAGGVAAKATAVMAAVTVAGGVVLSPSSDVGKAGSHRPGGAGARIGQVAPRGVTVPGNGVARGKTNAPGQAKRGGAASLPAAVGKGRAHAGSSSATSHARSSGHRRSQHPANHGAAAALAKGRSGGASTSSHGSASNASKGAKKTQGSPSGARSSTTTSRGQGGTGSGSSTSPTDSSQSTGASGSPSGKGSTTGSTGGAGAGKQP